MIPKGIDHTEPTDFDAAIALAQAKISEPSEEPQPAAAETKVAEMPAPEAPPASAPIPAPPTPLSSEIDLTKQSTTSLLLVLEKRIAKDIELRDEILRLSFEHKKAEIMPSDQNSFYAATEDFSKMVRTQRPRAPMMGPR